MTRLIDHPLSADTAIEMLKWRKECPSALRTPYEISHEQQYQWYTEHMRNRPHHCCRWLQFTEGATETAIAAAGLNNIQWENRTAEISLIVDPEAAGHGVGHEAATIMLEHAFMVMGLNTVMGEVYHCSPGLGFWQRFLEQWLGKVKTMTAPERKFFGGKFHDSTLFYIWWGK
jgi:RimJ/RimL family protein N-acetyltransferase